MKVVINNDYGGFGLSDAAYEWLIAQGMKVIKSKVWTDSDQDTEVIIDFIDDERNLAFGRYEFDWRSDDSLRTNPLLVECVETLGKAANGLFASLAVIEIPDDVEWEISDYDGWETIEEKHRSWR